MISITLAVADCEYRVPLPPRLARTLKVYRENLLVSMQIFIAPPPLLIYNVLVKILDIFRGRPILKKKEIKHSQE